MSHKPYMPFFTEDYMRDTSRLTTEEHGAYLLLLIDYWHSERPLPDDNKVLRSITKLNPKRFQKVLPVLKSLFTQKGPFFYHKRIEKELANYRRKVDLARAAGKKSAELRSVKNSTDVGTDVGTDVITTVEPYQITDNKYQIPDTMNQQQCARARAVDAEKFEKIDFGKRTPFVEYLIPLFPNIGISGFMTVKLSEGFNEWIREGVTLDDLKAAVDDCLAKGNIANRPEYYLPIALQFCNRRKKFGSYQPRGSPQEFISRASKVEELMKQQDREREEWGKD